MGFCEILNNIGPVSFALALGPHNGNNIQTDIFRGSGELKTDISAENSATKFFTITIGYFLHT